VEECRGHVGVAIHARSRATTTVLQMVRIRDVSLTLSFHSAHAPAARPSSLLLNVLLLPSLFFPPLLRRLLLLLPDRHRSPCNHLPLAALRHPSPRPQDATYALQPNQLSEVIESDSGVHVILRTG
jgi:hypothetical protein